MSNPETAEPYDKRGYPIHEGDLLRSYHFTGAGSRNRYLYHTAVMRNGRMHAVPTSHLVESKVSGGGDCIITPSLMHEVEIIFADEHTPYYQRSKLKADLS